MEKVIIDTDIGSDVDDLMALCLTINSPEIDLIGMTTVYGDCKLRGKIVYKVLEAAKKTGIPICPGKDESLLHNREIWMAGHEGKNAGADKIADDVLSSQHAADFIIEMADKYPGEINLMAIGPLTNVALAIIKSPDIVNKLKSIYVMGGVFGFKDPNMEMPLVEHNIKCDPEAAKIVFESAAKLFIISLDVTLKVPLTKEDIEKIGSVDADIQKFAYSELTTWLKWLKRDSTDMHDPLTIAALIKPELVKYKKRSVKVETKGEITTGMTLAVGDGNVSIATHVDVDKFHEFLMDRLIKQ